MSPRPNPTHPLKRKQGKALPRSPIPIVCAQIASSSVARLIRQKLARTPPSKRVVRLAETAEIANSRVVRNAGNIVLQFAWTPALVTPGVDGWFSSGVHNERAAVINQSHCAEMGGGGAASGTGVASGSYR